MKTTTGLAACAAVLCWWGLAPRCADAQVFSSGEIERGLRSGAVRCGWERSVSIRWSCVAKAPGPAWWSKRD